MRTIENIIAESSKATETALREAFEAGKAHATSELKSKVSAFFESLTGSTEAHTEPQHAPEAHVDSQQHQGDQQHQGEHHPEDHHY